MQTTGQVTVNGNAVPGTQTIFPGDTVVTGPNGAASLSIPDVGTITVAANTEIEFPISKFLSTVHRGTVGIRASVGAHTVEVQFGNYLVFVPEYENDATATVTLAADGSARIECQLGSVGVTAIEGAADVFLRPGQAVNVSATGALGAVENVGTPAGPTPGTAPTEAPISQPAATSPPKKKSYKTVYVLLGLGGGGAAAAGAALAGHHTSSTVSPSSPGGL